MTHQDASHVINLPVELVETVLQDIARWPHFVAGLQSVEKTSFERYVFRIQDTGRVREVPEVLVVHPTAHRITWHAQSGPAFNGEFRLTSLEGHRTRVHLSMVAEPAGFLSALGDMLGSWTSTAQLTLQRLDTESHATAEGRIVH
jgi:uncharacterized membrane protein